MRKIATYIISALMSVCALAQKPSTTSEFMNAVTEYTRGNVEAAREKFQKLLKTMPDDDAVNYYLGMCEFTLNNDAEAEAHLQKAVAADSTNEWYLHALATMYNAKGEMLKSAEICEKLIGLRPGYFSNTYTLTLIGDAKLTARQDSLALRYYDQALELDPEYAPAQLSRMEVLRFMGNMPAFFVAMDQFMDNMQVRPDIKSDYLKAIMEHMDSRFYWMWGEQLVKTIDKCRELHPDDIGIQNLRMQMCYIREDYDGVVEQCRTIQALAAAQNKPDKLVEALSTEGDIYHQRGDSRSAYEVYEKALKVNPEYAPVLNNYAYYLSVEGKSLKKALKMSKTAIDQEPDNATYLDTYAWILHLLGRSKEAKPYFKHAMIYGGKDSAVVLEHYAEVLKALGEDKLASYYQSLADQKK